MPLLIIAGALFLLAQLAKTSSITVEPKKIALNLNEGLPKLKVQLEFFNPSKISLRVTQLQAVATIDGIKFGEFSTDQVFAIRPETRTSQYVNLRVTNGVIQLGKLLAQGKPVVISGYAIANGVKVPFTRNVSA